MKVKKIDIGIIDLLTKAKDFTKEQGLPSQEFVLRYLSGCNCYKQKKYRFVVRKV